MVFYSEICTQSDGFKSLKKGECKDFAQHFSLKKKSSVEKVVTVM